MPASPRLQSSTLVVGVGIWLLLVVGGSVAVVRYKATAGVHGVTPAQWPVESVVPAGLGRATLVVLAHPKCPCTEASVSELARLLARVGDRVSAYVLLMQPEDAPQDWDASAMKARLLALPGVTVVRDVGGVEARRFGVSTSGHTLLYDKSGALLFSGGITPSRGHEGDSEGRQRILALLDDAGGGGAASAVFGCALHDD